MENILTLIGVFIAAAILIGIGTIILGGGVTDCTTIDGYNDTTPSAGEIENMSDTLYSTTPPIAGQSDWAEQCLDTETQSQSGYGLIGVTLIVLAAVIVLAVVRLLA